MAHDDIVGVGVLCGELFCPFYLEGIGIGGVSFIVVVVAVGVCDGIVLFAIARTPSIAKGIAKVGYH